MPKLRKQEFVGPSRWVVSERWHHGRSRATRIHASTFGLEATSNPRDWGQWHTWVRVQS